MQIQGDSANIHRLIVVMKIIQVEIKLYLVLDLEHFMSHRKDKKQVSYYYWFLRCHLISVQFSRSVMSDSLWPHESQHARPPCLSPSPGVHSDSHPSSPWCHPAISSSVIPFSSCLQSFVASGSFPGRQFFTSDGQIMELELQHPSFQRIFRPVFP